MADIRALGAWTVRRRAGAEPQASFVLRQHPLRCVLSFTGHSIDDVVNDPIARNRVRGYYKLHRLVDRRLEVLDLEQQWNSLGRR